LHPNRLRFSIFSDQNPAMRMVADLADTVRKSRSAAAADNPYTTIERTVSSGISASLELFGKARDAMAENLFLHTYASPLLQAVVGVGTEKEKRTTAIERDQLREREQAEQVARLEQRFEAGGAVEAVVRALAYIRGADSATDERGFAALKALREAQPASRRRSMAEFKELLKAQVMLLRLDEERAIGAIPKLLPRNQDERGTILDRLRHIVHARGPLTDEGARRMARIESLFGARPAKPTKETANA
jgi:hypothetical protein